MAEQMLQGIVGWAGDEKKFGNYSFKLEDTEEWFRSKKRNAGIVEQGNLIKVKATKNKKGAFDVTGVALVQEGAGETKSEGSSSTASNTGTGGNSRQASIVLQHSQEMATRTAVLLVQAGAVKLGKTKLEANKTIILDLIDELTARFYADANSPASFLEGRTETEAEEVEEEDDAEPEVSGDDIVWS